MNVDAKYRGNINNGKHIEEIIMNRNNNADLIYFKDSLYFSSESKFATKFTRPAEIPTSDKEIKIYIRFVAAENMPKSETVKALAATKVNKNPKKAEKTFPAKTIYVSIAVLADRT